MEETGFCPVTLMIRNHSIILATFYTPQITIWGYWCGRCLQLSTKSWESVVIEVVQTVVLILGQVAPALELKKEYEAGYH